MGRDDAVPDPEGGSYSVPQNDGPRLGAAGGEKREVGPRMVETGDIPLPVRREGFGEERGF